MDVHDQLTIECRGRVGTLLGEGYRLDALIGVGGMAAVYAASAIDGSMVAIKLLHPEIGTLAEARTRFLREASIANAVEHPATVKVFGTAVDDDGTPYIVMELLWGETIDARAARTDGRLPIDEVVQMADETLAVLEAAHKKTIIHRDIKPENLFITRDGKLKVLDFGIARLRESSELKTAVQTRTGMVMGTPAFMAPEQALGRWSDVDGRTDLWAVGATMFTLLTGLYVHEGDTANEMLVSAATRPARSLSRVLPGASVELVAVVDRALDYDRDKRFVNAAEMREALARIPKGSTSVRPPEVEGDREARRTAPRAPSNPRDAAIAEAATIASQPAIKAPSVASAPQKPKATTLKGPIQAADEARILRAFDRVAPLDTTEAQRAAIRDMLTTIDRAFVARAQYGMGHAETTRRYDRAFQASVAALATTDVGLAWQVSPYSFFVGESAVWEPESPQDRIPYSLFSAGIREIAILPGLTEAELFELLRIWVLDPITEISPEDDPATLLWDACFDHIFVHAIDSYSEGDQASRAAFANERLNVLAEVRSSDRDALEAAWQQLPELPPAAANDSKATMLIQHMASRAPGETDALVRAQKLGGSAARTEKAAEEALHIDPSTLLMLLARLEQDPTATSERFVTVAVEAFKQAHRNGHPEIVTTPLRGAVTGLAPKAPEKAVAFACALCQAIRDRSAGEVEVLRAALLGALIPVETMQLILAAAASGENADLAAALPLVLRYLDATHMPVVLDALPEVEDESTRELLLIYVAKWRAGYELAIGALFAKASVDLGLALVRLLAAIEGDDAREAILRATASPHAVVRIEALGHVEGVSSERVRTELRGLLEDKDPVVRVAALRAMEQYKIMVAGPFLVLRIRGSDFDALPLAERKQALATVCALTEARAEAVAIDLLGTGQFFSGEAREESRALAAEVLGLVGASGEAKAALERTAKQRFRATKRVREAAQEALAKIAERTSAAAPARKVVAS